MKFKLLISDDSLWFTGHSVELADAFKSDFSLLGHFDIFKKTPQIFFFKMVPSLPSSGNNKIISAIHSYFLQIGQDKLAKKISSAFTIESSFDLNEACKSFISIVPVTTSSEANTEVEHIETKVIEKVEGKIQKKEKKEKKRKIEEVEVIQKKQKITEKQYVKPFSRIEIDKVEFLDERLKDNSFLAKVF